MQERIHFFNRIGVFYNNSNQSDSGFHHDLLAWILRYRLLPQQLDQPFEVRTNKVTIS